MPLVTLKIACSVSSVVSPSVPRGVSLKRIPTVNGVVPSCEAGAFSNSAVSRVASSCVAVHSPATDGPSLM